MGAPEAPRPAWLRPEAIAERQGSVTERVMELALRLRAGLETNAEIVDPDQAALLEAAGQAAPRVEAAYGALRDAYTALDGGEPAGATSGQQAAQESLAAADWVLHAVAPVL